MVVGGRSFIPIQEEDRQAKRQQRLALKERNKRTMRMMMTKMTTRATTKERRAPLLEVEEGQTGQDAEEDGVEGGDVEEEEVVRNKTIVDGSGPPLEERVLKVILDAYHKDTIKANSRTKYSSPAMRLYSKPMKLLQKAIEISNLIGRARMQLENALLDVSSSSTSANRPSPSSDQGF